ncbi:hypothetical protein [Pelagibius sp. Alg239-R121]|nr:hypothetical protein [Pelagibius sp. Alg239-R121]
MSSPGAEAPPPLDLLVPFFVAFVVFRCRTDFGIVCMAAQTLISGRLEG